MSIESPEAAGRSSESEVLPLNYPEPTRMTRFRWVVLAMVFFAITINYVDRLVMGLLATDLQKEFSISNSQYGWINFSFALSYALGQLVCGGLLDRFGTRLGYALSLTAWSISSMLHAFARGPWSFGIARGL